MKQTRFRLFTLLAILVGFTLRLYHLGAESLWYDETVSVALAQKSVPALLRHTAGDIHPPGYYLLLHGWQLLTQPTPAFGLEFLYAWPSLWCGLIATALLFAIGRKLLTARVALLALWLAVVNPYHIWYSQEVRMYTLGAMLGLFCLWALLQWWQPPGKPSRHRWLIVYLAAGAAGLYTLYYFLFALLTLNGIALWFWRRRHPLVVRPLGIWLLAQGAILLLWLPWLPIFWRQITDPPVPPWRTPWATSNQFIAAMAESASALLSGQSTPAPTTWFWLFILGSVLLLALFGYTNKDLSNRMPPADSQRHFSQQVGRLILLAYLLVPFALITLITLAGTPLYHVRYLFTYAPPVMLLLATAITSICRRQRWLGSLLLFAVLLLNGWSLYQFWFMPAFRTDDHRSAVTQVAAAWRPGDAILVNAGWVYTALTTYWPTDLVGVDAANPPPLDQIIRLGDDQALWPQKPQPETVSAAAPWVVRTGSVDGASSLGWGDPASDFFAMSATTTANALTTLAQHANRLWHYRLYDTVSDPQGFIRTWLEAHNTLLAETAIPGRDYLRLQLYQNTSLPTAPVAWRPLPLPPAKFTGELQLQQVAVITPTVAAGTYLYTQLTWQPPVERGNLPPVLSFSLRLYTEDGYLLAQADETPRQPVAAWSRPYVYTMALPIPVSTPPGPHSLVLIAYAQQSGVPLTVQGLEAQQALPLGSLQITSATRVPIVTASLASFDYIDLVRARLSTARVAPGTALDLELIWHPHENAYRDTYLAQLTLQNRAGQVVAQGEATLGGWAYPSGIWPPLIPVRDWRTLPIAPTTPPGQYTLVLQVRRDSDKQIIPARRGWWSSMDTVVVGDVEIVNK